jgi:hypothetical protein
LNGWNLFKGIYLDRMTGLTGFPPRVQRQNVFFLRRNKTADALINKGLLMRRFSTQDHPVDPVILSEKLHAK